MATAHGCLSAGGDGGRRPAWRGYGREDLDFQYSPSRSAHAFADTLRRWKDRSINARSELAPCARLDVRYGTRPRQTLDWFGIAEPDTGKPIHVFIHGGFWQESSKDAVSFLAPAHLAFGRQFVAVGYTLAPEISLRGILGEIGDAFRFVQANASALGGDPARIVVSGHSAGAYLAASLMLEPAAAFCWPAAAVLVSGVFDLEPVGRSYVNDKLGLSPRDATALSLAGRQPAIDIPVRIVVGGDETAEFRRQSRHLFDGWRGGLSDIEFAELPGRDHFDILFDAGVYGGAGAGAGGVANDGAWSR
jgi:arylformamidase